MRGLRASLLSWFPTCGCAALEEHVVKPSHGGVAIFIAERQDLLQSEPYVRQISFDVAAPVMLLVKQHLTMQVLCELARALLQSQFDLS